MLLGRQTATRILVLLVFCCTDEDLFGPPPMDDEDSPFGRKAGLFSSGPGLFDEENDEVRIRLLRIHAFLPLLLIIDVLFLHYLTNYAYVLNPLTK